MSYIYCKPDIDESRFALVTMQTNDDDIFPTEPIYIFFKMKFFCIIFGTCITIKHLQSYDITFKFLFYRCNTIVSYSICRENKNKSTANAHNHEYSKKYCHHFHYHFAVLA